MDLSTAKIHLGKHDQRCLAFLHRATEGIDEFAARNASLSMPFSCPTYPTDHSKAPLPSCTEECTICAQQYLPSVQLRNPLLRQNMKFYTDAEAKGLAHDFVVTIRSNLGIVGERIGSHGDAILHRWQDYTIEKRAALVRRAMPNAFPQNFAPLKMDVEFIRAISASISRTNTNSQTFKYRDSGVGGTVASLRKKNRNANLLPYLDVQTMSEDPMCLLSLMHYRSHGDPADWALFDNEQVRNGFDQTLVAPPAYNPHAVVMQPGRNYGRLIAWVKEPAHRQDIIGFPRAILILEAQAELSQFLRAMASFILADGLEAARKGRVDWDALVLRERRDTMVDQLELLQTDPVYFRSHVRQIQDTAFYSRLTDDTARQQHTLSLVLSHIAWADLFNQLLYHAVTLSDIQAKATTPIHVGRALPEAYETHLQFLRLHLTNSFTDQIWELNRFQAATKTFQDIQIYPGNGKGHLQTDLDSDRLLRDHPLMYCMVELQARGHDFHRPTLYLAYINHLMSGFAEGPKEQVDSLFATHLANMTVIDDILVAMRYHRPQPELEHDSDVYRRMADPEKPHLCSPIQTSMKWEWPERQYLWKPLAEVLALPLPSAKASVEMLSRLKNLRFFLQKFWNGVSNVGFGHLSKNGHYSQKDAATIMARLVSFSHLKRCKEEAEEEYRTIEQAIEAKAAEAARKRPSTSSSIPEEAVPRFWSTEPETTTQEERKQKQKTRPTGLDPQLVDKAEELVLTDSVETPCVRLVVKPETKALFDLMFTASWSQQGHMKWETLVAAVVDAGCSVTPAGGASFTIKDIDNSKASVVFHRPHDGKIGPPVLRYMRAYLRKHFDWDADTFVEREKDFIKENGGKENGGKEAGVGGG
ncbi:hypothetical protein LTS10_012209 [Elasticomyces elasticus]|nr:hypothetical protein LTS10_012209 [Elasticomyces elasticus]